jgi:hypothetical protein
MRNPKNLNMSEKIGQEEDKLFSLPALRLACQEPIERWHAMSDRELEDRARFLGFRAVLEDYCEVNGLALWKRKRRGVNKVSLLSEEDYADCVIASYDLASQVADQLQLQSALVDRLKDSKTFLKTLLNLNVIQLSMQSMIEYLILLDRCLFLKQRGCEVELVDMFDPVFSPRNKVIIGHHKPS